MRRVHAPRKVAASSLGPSVRAAVRAFDNRAVAQFLEALAVAAFDRPPVDVRRGVVQFLHPPPAVLFVAAFRVVVEAMLGRWRERRRCDDRCRG